MFVTCILMNFSIIFFLSPQASPLHPTQVMLHLWTAPDPPPYGQQSTTLRTEPVPKGGPPTDRAVGDPPSLPDKVPHDHSMPSVTNIPNISYNFNLFVNVDDKLKFDNVKAADDKRRMIIVVLMFSLVWIVYVFMCLWCVCIWEIERGWEIERVRVRDRKRMRKWERYDLS